MNDPWIPLLTSLPLSRTEREVVKRFEIDPEGRTFLPVADILRTHKLVTESLELLTQGVERHPTFTVARVVLARELLQKGMVESAWRALEESPVSLRENLLAQKLRFRLALLLSDEPAVRSTFAHLKRHQMLDAETKRLGDMLEVTGLQAAHDQLVRDLRDKGVEPILPPVASEVEPEIHAASAPPDQESEPPAGKPTKFSGSSYLPSDALADEGILHGFHVVPLHEIFNPGDSAGPRQRALGGVELDSTTLADIYARQGHYSKALEVYRRLLRMTPGSDLLRRKVAELARLDREQKVSDLTVDPALVDRMETVEILDRQMRFYHDLLTRLS